jgi:hypothetical protein
MTIGGPVDVSRNPVLALAQASENISKRSALRVWETAFPGVAPPDTGAGGILSAILDNGQNLHPPIIDGVGIVHSGIAYGNRLMTLPDGWELVRRYY